MKIKELYFKNHAHRWELERTTFPDLTLLVGASGVGKTQILKSIQKLVNISNGDCYNGVEWDLSFTAADVNYRWTGTFEVAKQTDPQPKLLHETLYLEGKPVFVRSESKVKYERKNVPKISPHISVLNLFTTEDKILPVKEAFKKIAFVDYKVETDFEFDAKVVTKNLESFENDLTDLNTLRPGGIKPNVGLKILETIESKNYPEVIKIFFLWLHYKKKFEEIVNNYKDIFPQVEDIRFELLKEHDIYELQIKEKGTDWISRNEISSGMFKTLVHIAQSELMTDGYVILIDEFENSLGGNCIDSVADDLLKPGRNIQYIITSHHPYIINNIDMKYWKVVTRKGAKVFTTNTKQLKLGKSRHDAFKQLLNLEEFVEGIA